jgi:methylase of polypeptide subunit release factors
MRLPKTAYELRQSQVSTPPEVVALFWRVLRQYRADPGKVLDLGSGDGRFARGGYFERYDGIEIDPSASKGAVLPANAKIKTGCAFAVAKKGYDACIGNPPYVRHHDIEQPWKGKVADTIEQELGVTLSGIGNLYLYFLCLALLRTKKDGLVAFVMPFEWVSRPSAQSVRYLLESKGWKVGIYRFETSIFEDVLTTASITIIDKAIYRRIIGTHRRTSGDGGHRTAPPF